MEVDELYFPGSQKHEESQCPPMAVGDMEAVEALMFMNTHWKARTSRSFKHRQFRPLTPSSDFSEDDSCLSLDPAEVHESLVNFLCYLCVLSSSVTYIHCDNPPY